MNQRILLVEDDDSLRETTALVLERAGLVVDTEKDGQAAISRIRSEPFDLIVLDIMLPTLDGLEVCRAVRKDSNIPIVMLTALAETTDLVVGLELGADDYITKPFDPPALVARIRAVMRRSSGEPHAPIMSAGSLEVDPGAFRVTKAGELIELPATEAKLLIELMRHAGQVMTRQTLLWRVWEYEYMGDSRMVDMAVKRLRNKVEDDPAKPKLINTVRGIGYRFDMP